MGVLTIIMTWLKFKHLEQCIVNHIFSNLTLKQRNRTILGPYCYTMKAIIYVYKLINDTEIYHDNDLRVSTNN